MISYGCGFYYIEGTYLLSKDSLNIRKEEHISSVVCILVPTGMAENDAERIALSVMVEKMAAKYADIPPSDKSILVTTLQETIKKIDKPIFGNGFDANMFS